MTHETRHVTFKLVMPIEDLIKSIEETSNVKVIGYSVSGDYATIVTKEPEPEPEPSEDRAMLDMFIKAFDALGDIDAQNRVADEFKERVERRRRW